MAQQLATTMQRYWPVGGARELIMARDPEVLIAGPGGTGKTLASCYKLHFAALKYPGVRLLMARKVLEDLKTGALSTFINIVQPQLAGVRQFGGNRFYPAEFRYPNGSVMMVVGMDKPGKVMSAEFDMAYVNEATELNETDWEALSTRLRNGKMPYQMLFGDCNPSGARHWLNLRCNDGRTRRIVSVHKDNPAYWDPIREEWTPIGQRYVNENLKNLTGAMRKRMYDGIWASAEGMVYDGFTDEHIRSQDVDGWRTILAVDVGSRNPTAILTIHIAGDERVHVSREVYRRNMTASEIVAAVETEADLSKPDTIFLDPSAKGYIDDLIRDGYPAEKAENDVLVGIQRVQAVIAHGFSVDPACVNLIEEFGMYAYPDNPKVETDKPVKDHDHALDALRYGIVGITAPMIDLAAYYRSQTRSAA